MRQSCLRLISQLSVVFRGIAGVEAAQAQMLQMQSELELLKLATEEEMPAGPQDDEEVAWRQVKLMECRALRPGGGRSR